MRRAALAVAAVVTAVATVVVVGLRLPLTGDRCARAARRQRCRDPRSALDGALGVLTSRPTIVAAIVIVGMAAASASLARSRGLWGVAAWGAAFLGACFSCRSRPAGSVAPLWAAPAVWLAAAALAYPLVRTPR